MRQIARGAFDRPGMLRDGSDFEALTIPPGATCLLVMAGRRESARAVGAVLAIPADWAADAIEIHVMLRPECRGRVAIEAFETLRRYFRATSGYRRILGFVPEYNRPMLHLAALAGMRRVGRREGSVWKDGERRDEVIIECSLG
jgi:RimJ/RimL family protein N-acetyltransferase